MCYWKLTELFSIQVWLCRSALCEINVLHGWMGKQAVG
jgi:hypothetical protein